MGDKTYDELSANSAIQLLRTMQQHHVQLSAMADQKASILIGATFVVFTIIIGQSQGKAISAPFLVLALSSFVASSLGVLSILPSIQTKLGANPNFMFFGAFAKLSESEFVEEMAPVLADQQHAHRTMLRDIYQNGLVLQRKKYRYLSYAYRVFLAGLIVTFVLFMGRSLAFTLD